MNFESIQRTANSIRQSINEITDPQVRAAVSAVSEDDDYELVRKFLLIAGKYYTASAGLAVGYQNLKESLENPIAIDSLPENLELEGYSVEFSGISIIHPDNESEAQFPLIFDGDTISTIDTISTQINSNITGLLDLLGHDTIYREEDHDEEKS